MKEKIKNVSGKILNYCEDNSEGLMILGYGATMVFTVIYLICASISVAKHGISYRR